jgi:hypothetical protein
VCCNGACKVHKHTLSASGSSGRTTQVDYDLERYKDFKKQVAGRKKAAARAQLVRAMVGRVGAKIRAELLREVVINLMNSDGDSSVLLRLLGLDPKTAKAADFKKIIGKAKDVQLKQLLVAAILLGSVDGHRDDSKERSALLFAKVLGLKTGPAILATQDERISKERACRGCGCTEETRATSGMETNESPVRGSNRTSARIQTARSTQRLPKSRRLQRVLEVNRKDE